MGIDALTRDDDGRLVDPRSDGDWWGWVSATATRNHALHDPLLDWLGLFGEARGYIADDHIHGYDPRTDFRAFVFDKGRRFEQAVLEYLGQRVEIVTIATERKDIRDLAAAEGTVRAMMEGAPIIAQGVLRNAQDRTYGAPDLLIRSDVLRRLFPEALDEEDAARKAPGIGGGDWHYLVVDIKFTTLHLSAGGTLRNEGSSPAYKLQLHTYNHALGRLQGYEPEHAYLVGRSWEQKRRRETLRGLSCVDRPGPVPLGAGTPEGLEIALAAENASEWVRRLRREGADWLITPSPSRPELYPNMSHRQDGAWHQAKRQIAEALEELTLLPQVGLATREKAHVAGIFRWRDDRCTPEALGFSGGAKQAILRSVLDINRTNDGPPVGPERIATEAGDWRSTPALEFYVDFESVSDLDDDFSRMPERGGQPLIFMIGCGHMEDGQWRFASFSVDAFTSEAEAVVIDTWLAHMAGVRARLAPDGDGEEPRVIHWSPAETTTFDTAYNSARERHPERSWPSPRWFDFLGQVVRAEPVVVRGAMGFGLKAVASALHSHGCIETLWPEGPADGLGAMVGAWWCDAEARRTGQPLREIDLMRQIIAYNEVDCRAMMETVRFLRERH